MSEGKRKCIEDIHVVALPPDWNNFQSKEIPSYFNYGHIHHYTLESIESLVTDYDEDADCDLGHMTDKPLKNAWKYVDSGFVHDVMDAKSKDCYFVRKHVWPSMRTELPHNVSVVLSNLSGAGIHAFCEPCKVLPWAVVATLLDLLLFCYLF